MLRFSFFCDVSIRSGGGRSKKSGAYAKRRYSLLLRKYKLGVSLADRVLCLLVRHYLFPVLLSSEGAAASFALHPVFICVLHPVERESFLIRQKEGRGGRTFLKKIFPTFNHPTSINFCSFLYESGAFTTLIKNIYVCVFQNSHSRKII